MRKTIAIKGLINEVNDFLRDSAKEERRSRQMMAMMLEKILIDNEVYNGFRYLDGWPCEDDSRVSYYIDHRLR